MSRPSRNWAFISFLLLTVIVMLACGVSINGPEAAATSAPALDATKIALEIQATAASVELTQAANSQVQQQPTPAPPPTAAPTQAVPTAVPTMDIEAKIKGANILLYEDTDELGIGQWIEAAIQGMGIQYTQTGSYSGHFMEFLDSGTKYDLIIVGTEDRSKITGEFWDVINQRLTRDKAGLIAELWYLEHEWNGPVSNIFGPCGVQYRVEYQSAQSVYWWDPTSEVFNTPNTVLPLLHYSTYWWTEAGDKLMLNGGDAKMLAGLSSMPSTGEGVLATCDGGRVLLQTFCNHDYHEADIVPLWQNYIHYTLKNHFLALEQP